MSDRKYTCQNICGLTSYSISILPAMFDWTFKYLTLSYKKSEKLNEEMKKIDW